MNKWNVWLVSVVLNTGYPLELPENALKKYQCPGSTLRDSSLISVLWDLASAFLESFSSDFNVWFEKRITAQKELQGTIKILLKS